MKNIPSLLLATAIMLASSHAATIAEYNFTGGSLISSDLGTNWTTSDIDITSNAAAGGNGSFDTTSLADALTYNWLISDGNTITLTNFASFTIQADPGYNMTLTQISFRAYTPASPGANPTVYFRSNADGFANNLVAQDLPKSQSGFLPYLATISDTLGASDVREFRLYFDSGSAGNANDIYIDDIQITGTATAIPEPSAVLLGGIGTLALLRRRR